MTIYSPISSHFADDGVPVSRRDGAARDSGDRAMHAPDGFGHDGFGQGGISPRGRLAVIVVASAWLWAGLAAIGHYTLG